MGWEISDQEFGSVLALEGRLRYECLLKRAVDRGSVWSLRSDQGWDLLGDDEGTELILCVPETRIHL